MPRRCPSHLRDPSLASRATSCLPGALTGIGRATAAAFARQHATVVASGRHIDAGEFLAKELQAADAADAAFIAADVRFESTR
jgi:NADP-dependent 3-hydroxy acid dehydrogenase YdfG